MASSDGFTYFVIASLMALGLACFGMLTLRQAQAPHALRVVLPSVQILAQREPAPVQDPFAGLRAKLHWVPTKVGRETFLAPDFESRMLLAKSAAARANLAEVGLTYKDVYAIINAETSWAPRRGASRDGTPNLGIAQFEPATAKALGLRDPDDPVEAVYAAAIYMKEAALWSRERLRKLKLGKAERAEKLREGISIYYNLSTHGRNLWNGMNTASLPIETQRHILNAKLGAREAEMLDAQMRARSWSHGPGVMTAKASDARS